MRLAESDSSAPSAAGFTPLGQWYETGLLAGTGVQFVNRSTSQAGVTIEGESQSIAPSAGTLKGLFVNFTAASLPVADVTFIVNVNGVNTVITCQVLHTAQSGSDTTHSVAVNAGDRVSIQCQATVSDASTIRLSAVLGFQPSP
jgi:hypothetical protein